MPIFSFKGQRSKVKWTAAQRVSTGLTFFYSLRLIHIEKPSVDIVNWTKRLFAFSASFSSANSAKNSRALV